MQTVTCPHMPGGKTTLQTCISRYRAANGLRGIRAPGQERQNLLHSYQDCKGCANGARRSRACKQCGAYGLFAKGMCRRCYLADWRDKNREHKRRIDREQSKERKVQVYLTGQQKKQLYAVAKKVGIPASRLAQRFIMEGMDGLQ